jgi:hypothetical protein
MSISFPPQNLPNPTPNLLPLPNSHADAPAATATTAAQEPNPKHSIAILSLAIRELTTSLLHAESKVDTVKKLLKP